MENLLGLPHSHTPELTPIFPSDFLPIRERIFLLFLLGLKAIGGHILSIQYFPILCQTKSQLSLYPHRGGIYYQYSISLFLVIIIACPDGAFKSPGQAYIINTVFPYLIKAPCRPRYDLVPAPALAAAPPAQATAPWPFRQGGGTSLAGADPENPSPH